MSQSPSLSLDDCPTRVWVEGIEGYKSFYTRVSTPLSLTKNKTKLHKIYVYFIIPLITEYE